MAIFGGWPFMPPFRGPSNWYQTWLTNKVKVIYRCLDWRWVIWVFFLFGFYGPSRLFHSFLGESIVRWGGNGRSPRKTTRIPASRTFLTYPTRFFRPFHWFKKFLSYTRGYKMTLIMCPRILGNVKTKSVSIILHIVNSFSQNAVYSKPVLFAKVKAPSLNVERNNGPDHTVQRPLWSNFIRFCKYCLLCRGSSVFLLSNIKEKATNCMHC